MEKTFAGIEEVIINLDDITVTAPNDEQHLERLAKVLEQLRLAGFRLKKEKCEFLKERLEFLGHVLDAQWIRPSPKKTEAMLNMTEPQNVEEMESFLGMVQYYGKFVLRNSGVLWEVCPKLSNVGGTPKWPKEERCVLGVEGASEGTI